MTTINIIAGPVPDPALEKIGVKDPALQAQVKADPELRKFLEKKLSVLSYAKYLEKSYKNHSGLNLKNGITWCTATANYRSGCDRITAGCGGKISLFGRSWDYRCWAEETNDSRLMKMKNHARFGHIFGDKLVHPERLPGLRRGQNSADACEVVFVGSITDLFNDDVPERYTELEFHFLEKYTQHVYIILTKRPAQMAKYIKEHYTDLGHELPDHIILGVSITGGAQNAKTDRQYAEILRGIPCTTRMVSLEPMLGPLDPSVSFKGLQWIIVGGTSGKDAPPMDPAWAQDALERAADDGAAAHFKQNGEWAQQSDAGRPSTGLDEISSADGASVPLYRYGVTIAGRKLNGKFYDGFPAVIMSRASLYEKILKQLEKHTHAHDPKEKRAQTEAPQAMVETRSFNSVTLDQVPDEAIEYLWEPYLAKKMLSLISGPRGSGKTHLALDLCARVTTGKLMPGEAQGRLPADVAYFFNDAMPPSLLKTWFTEAGGDLTRFHLVDLEHEASFGDMDRIANTIRKWKPALVAFDPLDAYLCNRSNPRRELTNLNDLATSEDFSALIVAHPPKDGSTSVKGSGSIMDVARSIVFTAKMKDGCRGFVHERCTYAKEGPSWTYRIDDGVKWSDENPDLAKDDLQKGRSENKVLIARAIWLKALGRGPTYGKDVFKTGADAGVSRKSMERARDGLTHEGKITTFRDGERTHYKLVPYEQGDAQSVSHPEPGEPTPSKPDDTTDAVVEKPHRFVDDFERGEGDAA